MTRQGCNGGARGAVAAPLRHCEARSAVAIHVPAPRPQWIASFLAMTQRRQ